MAIFMALLGVFHSMAHLSTDSTGLMQDAVSKIPERMSEKAEGEPFRLGVETGTFKTRSLPVLFFVLG